MRWIYAKFDYLAVKKSKFFFFLNKNVCLVPLLGNNLKWKYEGGYGNDWDKVLPGQVLTFLENFQFSALRA